jgi:hypothetical protein
VIRPNPVDIRGLEAGRQVPEGLALKLLRNGFVTSKSADFEGFVLALDLQRRLLDAGRQVLQGLALALALQCRLQVRPGLVLAPDPSPEP